MAREECVRRVYEFDKETVMQLEQVFIMGQILHQAAAAINDERTIEWTSRMQRHGRRGRRSPWFERWKTVACYFALSCVMF